MTPIWVTIVLGLLVPISNIITFSATLRYTARKEAERRVHEKDLKVMELEENKLKKKRDERIKAYRQLLQVTRDIDYRGGYEFSDLTEAYTEVELVSDSQALIRAANYLVAACNDARKVVTDAYKKDPHRELATLPVVREAVQGKDQVREHFMKVAKEDLDTSVRHTPGVQLGQINPAATERSRVP